jgi:hypothetical protein
MRRRDFAIGLLLLAAARTVRAQEPVKQYRIAIVRPAGSLALISDTGTRVVDETRLLRPRGRAWWMR